MEDKTMCLLILGIVAVIAIVGLIMLFSEMSKSGASIASAQGQCPIGSNAHDYMTAQGLMMDGVDCQNFGVKWCCANFLQ